MSINFTHDEDGDILTLVGAISSCRVLLQIDVFLERFFVFSGCFIKSVNWFTHFACGGMDFENSHSVRICCWFSGALLSHKGY